MPDSLLQKNLQITRELSWWNFLLYLSINSTWVKGKWPTLPLSSPSHCPLILILVTFTISPTCKHDWSISGFNSLTSVYWPLVSMLFCRRHLELDFVWLERKLAKIVVYCFVSDSCWNSFLYDLILDHHQCWLIFHPPKNMRWWENWGGCNRGLTAI